MNQSQLGGPQNPAESCLQIKRTRWSSASGIYWFNTSDTRISPRPFQAYCDMETDGGGWMLALAYHKKHYENNVLDSSALPTDPFGYSHSYLFSLEGFQSNKKFAKEARFYCKSSAHNRQIHFKVEDLAVLRAVLTGRGYGCLVTTWTRGWTPLDGHNGHLPAATDSCWNEMIRHPFFKGHQYHWNIRYHPPDTEGYRWECDDLSGGVDHSTLHNIWIR
eukprot:NODE_3847_length_1275_cov_47.805556_g3372_i0.p1 GENE.NODE_3847_length_1275_cov_47.805556_g3372_i0~~NODE_3847_length_1275_cov_47.805556_g3372_i0.p1  ORF type:complete len:219 (+),score=27.70 NODE_3847_length_1275_cov_47.805556_g3372_i0:483-1139(+)